MKQTSDIVAYVVAVRVVSFLQDWNPPVRLPSRRRGQPGIEDIASGNRIRTDRLRWGSRSSQPQNWGLKSIGKLKSRRTSINSIDGLVFRS
jgi:hypothetical protein